MKTYPKPTAFDGAKFAVRYGLSAAPPADFWISGSLIYVPDNLPDDPPIFDPLDPLIPAPAGLWVHEMKSLTKRQGSQLVDGAGTACFHIVAETELMLSDPWLFGVSIEIGSTAYIIDKGKTIVWDGVKWK